MRIVRAVFMALAALALAACGQVDPGERATFTRWGVMDQQCYASGFYTYEPVGTNMDVVSVQTQRFDAVKLAAATSDVQEVHADVVVNYHIDPERCHLLLAQIGYDYKNRVLAPAVYDALKAGTAHFNLATIIRDREKLREMIKADLKSRLEPQYLVLDEVNLTNFEVSQQFAAAVEAKQVEEQKAEQKKWQVVQAQRDAEVRAARAKGEADAAREAAKGTADALRIEAVAQAEYNAKVSASLSPILVQNRAVDAWRAGGSQVPTVTGAGGLLLQVPVPQPAKARE